MNIQYLRAGEYRIPALTIPESEPLNRFGRLRKAYLQENLPNEYTALMITGQLQQHLTVLGAQAQKMYEQLMGELEQLNPAPNKALNAAAWVMHMRKLQNQAEEEVLTTLVYA